MSNTNLSESGDRKDNSAEGFLYPTSRYYGKFTPEQLAFNANLQEFAQRVSVLCSLETGGKLSAEETYQQIKQLWQDLKASKQQLLDRDQEPPSALTEDDH